MENLYITHYYFKDTDPWKNIMNLPEEDAFKKAAELADEHPDTTSFGRFADFVNYYPQRVKADAYVREEFIKLGGKPQLDHPYSFVLLECEYLKEWFSDGKSFRIDLNNIPEDVISFTIGDSCAQITNGMIPAVMTKKMLFDDISRFDSPEEYLKAVLGKFAYIEVQLWTSMDDSTKNWRDRK